MSASDNYTRVERCHQAKHGLFREYASEWRSWMAARNRCYRPEDISYHNYGGRGIGMCARWQKSFPAFLEDMGPKPSPKHSLDRERVNGHYEPGNCRWATAKEQKNNTRVNRVLTVGGVSMTVSQWAELRGLDQQVVAKRIYAGWSQESAVNTPARAGSKSLTFLGETHTIAQWSEKLGIPRHVIHDRLYSGWTVERTLSSQARKMKKSKTA